MLTVEDKDEIRRMIADALASAPATPKLPQDLPGLVNIVARAIEVFGTGEKALRWLQTPVPALDQRTPLSLLNTPKGVIEVQAVLTRVEHGVW